MKFKRPVLNISYITDNSRAFFSVNNLFSNISTVLIYIALFMKDVLSQHIGVLVISLVLGAGLVSGLISMVFRFKVLANFSIATTLFFALLIWIVTIFFTQSVNLSPYYLAIPVAYILINQNLKLFFILLSLHLIASILIQAFEYVNGYYVFTYIANDETVLNAKLFGGHAEIIRSKGLFQGPLSAVAFALWMAIFSRMENRVTIMLFISTFFASGRLGMLVATIFLLINFLSNKNKFSYQKLMSSLLVISSLMVIILASSQTRLDFILSALDFGSSQNLSRFALWAQSLSIYMEYTAMQMLFGGYEFMSESYLPTENDFLGIMLNGGLFLLLIYLSGLFYIIKYFAFKYDIKHTLIPFVIILLMFIFPFIQSLPMGVLFWVFIFTLHMQNIKSKQY